MALEGGLCPNAVQTPFMQVQGSACEFNQQVEFFARVYVELKLFPLKLNSDAFVFFWEGRGV